MNSAPLPLLSATRSALLGLAVGDALGVPVEFEPRETRQRDPVGGMRGFGAHRQLAGTWSDDTSLACCLAESLVHGYSLTDLADRFVRWLDDAYWTARGAVFDVGIATHAALYRVRSGTLPQLAGGTGEYDNGNGALMRVLPLLFHPTWLAPTETPVARLTLTAEVASLTHRHPRSILSCYFYLETARHLLRGVAPSAAVEQMRAHAAAFVPTVGSAYQAELPHFERILSGELPWLPEVDIQSSGYVVHTLEAALWCLLTHPTYEGAVLSAVNLGDDTDTTGSVTGGLAGLAYGEAAIPAEWLTALARRADLEDLAGRLAQVAGSTR